MATKASENAAENTESREESSDGPLMDSMSAAVKKMVGKAKERGYVTYDELNKVLPPDQMSSEQIEDTMSMLSEMGISVIESEEPEDNTPEEAEKGPVAGNIADEDIGRTDDPVRMYLREMGSVELLSREGEIAIAKRIEAGREKMIGGICESPLTIKALLFWRESLNEGRILLRDIIDLDATYGGGPTDAEMADEELGVNDQVEEEAGDPAAKANGEDKSADAAKANGEDRSAGAASANGEDKSAGAAPAGEDGSKANGADSEAGGDGASTSTSTSTSESDDDDEEDTTISLAAMEEVLLPIVLKMFDEIARTYKKLDRAQDKRLAALQRGQKVAPQSERHYEKTKLRLIELMDDVHFNNARIEQLVEQLYDLNKRLIGLEGKLLRLAEKQGVKRQDFLDHYFGRELDPRWLSRVKRLKGKGWAKFAERRADEAKEIRKQIAEIAEETGLPITEFDRDGRGQPAPGHFDRQEVHQPRPAVPGLDPGGQHRPDESGRQVRVPSRLQVLDLRHLVDPPGDHPLDRRRCSTRSAASRPRRSWRCAWRCRSTRCARCSRSPRSRSAWRPRSATKRIPTSAISSRTRTR